MVQKTETETSNVRKFDQTYGKQQNMDDHKATNIVEEQLKSEKSLTESDSEEAHSFMVKRSTPINAPITRKNQNLVSTSLPGSPIQNSFLSNHITHDNNSSSNEKKLDAHSTPNTSEIKYFINDDITKHRTTLPNLSISSFCSHIKQNHKINSDFAIFTFENESNKLRVLKEGSEMKENCIYYVIENNKMDSVYKKIEKRAKKDQLITYSDKNGKQIFTSDNFPIKVDFIPDDELYLNQMGRLGLCMAPGRCKKSSNHEWNRDLDKDLTRIKELYGCNTVVSLIRHSELYTLSIPNLFEEIEKRDMESIHFPIKDKWIPDSMTDLVKLVDIILQRLKQGKTVVVHCNGGKGRSGTVVVACLVAMGKKVQNSIEVVRKARSGTIRNPLQIMYVKRFKKAWKAYLRKKNNKNSNDTTFEIDETELMDDGDDSSEELDLTGVSAELLEALFEDKKQTPDKKKKGKQSDDKEMKKELKKEEKEIKKEIERMKKEEKEKKKEQKKEEKEASKEEKIIIKMESKKSNDNLKKSGEGKRYRSCEKLNLEEINRDELLSKDDFKKISNKSQRRKSEKTRRDPDKTKLSNRYSIGPINRLKSSDEQNKVIEKSS